MKNNIQAKKVITPEFRVSFPAVFTAKAFQNQEPKYSVVMLFSKKTDISELKKAAMNAAAEKFGNDKTKWPKNLKMPFRDGDEKADTPGYKDTIFVTASSKQRPGLVDRSRQAILSEEDFYAGCYARAELIAFAYDTAGNRGVSFSLQNIQKLKEGEKFSGRKAAEDVFDSVEDDSDNPDNYGSSDADDEYDLGV